VDTTSLSKHKPGVRNLRRLLCAIPILLGLAALAAGDPTPPSAYALKPKPSPKIDSGKIAAAHSEVSTEPDRYVVENLTILQPVQLIVLTKKAGENVKVELSKHLWDQVEQEATTEATGTAVFKFRTEGDMKIKVSSADGQSHPYQIILWVGDPQQPPIKSPFVSMAAFKKNEPASGGIAASPVLWAIAGLLGAIVILLAIIVLKKKRA
jgi:hypothetical protein